jgi:hypothetical protein
MTPLDPVFNEHSREPLAADRHAAKQRISDFIQALLAAPAHGLGRLLRIPEDFYQASLAANYTISNWLDDHTVRREETSFMLQVAASVPYLKDAPANVLERQYETEVRYDNIDSPCFCAARLLDVPLISLNHGPWAEPILNAVEVSFEDDSTLSEIALPMVNIATADHFTVHAEWINDRRIRQVESMESLLEHSSTMLPHLDFSDTASEQLPAISPTHRAFDLTLARLFEMERYAADHGADFDPGAFKTKCHPSSQSTLEKYPAEYQFTTGNGGTFICGWHFYLPDGWRIYFARNGNRFVVGHVGKHLPTRRFPG